MKTLIVLASALALGTVACGSSSGNSGNAADTASTPVVTAPVTGADAVVDPTAPATTPVVTAPVAVAFEVDATNKEAWAYLDIDTAKLVDATDASWDLAFKRTSLKMNGATVSAVRTAETDFDAVLVAPETGYASDAVIAGATSETAGLFFHTGDVWYTYDMETHTISARPTVYVVKSNAGLTYKVSLLDYYNADRLPAFINLKWQELVAPATTAAAE